MKNKKRLLLILLLMNLINLSIAMGDTLPPQPLTLSPNAIAKLNHYFPTDNNNPTEKLNLSLDTGFSEEPQQHIVWDGETPIKIILPVGKERIIRFPTVVELGYDRSVLSSSLLQAQNNNDTLYLTASQAFTTQRVKIKLIVSDKIIYLDLSAQNQGASSTPLDIVIKDPVENFSENNLAELNSDAANINYLTLTRFAAQQLYAPQRLLTELPANIYRTPMHTHRTIPLFLDGSVMAMPLASWRGGDLTVTAVLLRNLLKQQIDLDPRNLCGSWRAASFFPQNHLARAGDSRDSTTVFLVSNGAFADAISECEARG